MATFRQSSFIGGMLSPSLEGRTDYDKRLAGARRIHNFLVTPYGTLRRRPGFQFLAYAYGAGGVFGESGGQVPQAAPTPSTPDDSGDDGDSGGGDDTPTTPVTPPTLPVGLVLSNTLKDVATWRNIPLIAGDTMHITIRAHGLRAGQTNFIWQISTSDFARGLRENDDGRIAHTFEGEDGKVLNFEFRITAAEDRRFLGPDYDYRYFSDGTPLKYLVLSMGGAPGQGRVVVTSATLAPRYIVGRHAGDGITIGGDRTSGRLTEDPNLHQGNQPGGLSPFYGPQNQPGENPNPNPNNPGGNAPSGGEDPPTDPTGTPAEGRTQTGTTDPDPDDITVSDLFEPSDAEVRYIPFRGHNNEDTLLVLGHYAGIAVVNGALHPTTPQFDHPWRGRHLRPIPGDESKPGIKWSQSGGRLLITHPLYEPRYLVAPRDLSETWRVESGSQPVNAPNLATFSADYKAAVDARPASAGDPERDTGEWRRTGSRTASGTSGSDGRRTSASTVYFGSGR